MLPQPISEGPSTHPETPTKGLCMIWDSRGSILELSGPVARAPGRADVQGQGRGCRLRMQGSSSAFLCLHVPWGTEAKWTMSSHMEDKCAALDSQPFNNQSADSPGTSSQSVAHPQLSVLIFLAPRADLKINHCTWTYP